MTFVITETCIDTMDQACVSVCPVDCIHFEEGQDRMLYINPAECIDCGACQPACPVSAIFPESDVPEAQAKFIDINSLWYDDPAAARAQVGGGAPAAAAAPVAEAPASEAPAAADAPAAEAEPAAEGAPASPTAEAVAKAATDADKAVAASQSPSPALEPVKEPAPAGTYKYGENGVEGKCAICGTYVIKGGVPFGRKSVLCPDDAKKQTAYLETAGRR